MTIYYVHFATEDLPKDEEGSLASIRELDKYLISKMEKDNVGGSVLLRRLAVVKITTRYKPHKIPEYFPIEDIDIETGDLPTQVPGLNLFLLRGDGTPTYIMDNWDVTWSDHNDNATALFEVLPFLKQNYVKPSEDESWWNESFQNKLYDLKKMLTE